MNLIDAFMTKKPGIDAPPIAMTIAGSDSGGGAGLQADLKTFAAMRCHGTSVVTLVTAQNTQRVSEIHPLPHATIAAQLAAVRSDLPPAASKTGALGSAALIAFLSELLQENPLPNLVVDPVMVSKHGDPLLPDAAKRTFIEQLLPHALVITPNRYEAQVLTGRTVEGPSSMKDAAKALFDLGARNVVMKGSHLDRIVRDYVYDGTGFVEFGADRVDSDRVHGSGCVHSAAITAGLAHGKPLMEAIEAAREFITRAIELAPPLGSGIAPVNPMHEHWT